MVPGNGRPEAMQHLMRPTLRRKVAATNAPSGDWDAARRNLMDQLPSAVSHMDDFLDWIRDHRPLEALARVDEAPTCATSYRRHSPRKLLMPPTALRHERTRNAEVK